MSLAVDLLTIADAYCASRQISRARLSTLLVNDSRTLDRVAAGGSLTVRTLERCLAWMSERWPADLDWPTGTPRPEVRAAVHPSHRASAA